MIYSYKTGLPLISALSYNLAGTIIDLTMPWEQPRLVQTVSFVIYNQLTVKYLDPAAINAAFNAEFVFDFCS